MTAPLPGGARSDMPGFVKGCPAVPEGFCGVRNLLDSGSRVTPKRGRARVRFGFDPVGCRELFRVARLGLA
jgi:hypothetical protein